MLLFTLSLGMKKTAEHNRPIAFETRIGGEDHVRRARLRLNQNDVCYLRNCFVEMLPLLRGFSS